ncbi:MAG: hypothetical protein IPP94_11320 [Ignavibacteria bacterium]|nr:hypothetical protein [Ignavibacteria bacterium]
MNISALAGGGSDGSVALAATTSHSPNQSNLILRSIDGGLHWVRADNGPPSVVTDRFAILADESNRLLLFAQGTMNGYGRLYRSIDTGRNWSRCDMPSGAAQAGSILRIAGGLRCISNISDPVGRVVVLHSSDEGAKWLATDTLSISWAVPTAILPGTTDVYALGGETRMSRINLDRRDWLPIGIPAWHVNTLVHCVPQTGGHTLFAASSSGVHTATAGGGGWTYRGFTHKRIDGFSYTDVTALVASFNGDIMFAGTNGGGIHRSTNRGTSWTGPVASLQYAVVGALAMGPGLADTSTLFAGIRGSLRISTNLGASWMPGSLAVPELREFHVDSTSPHSAFVFAGSTRGVFVSTDLGLSWLDITGLLPSNLISALASSPDGMTLFVGTDDAGAYRSTDLGRTWTPINAGLADVNVHSFAVVPLAQGGYCLFAGTKDNGVWKSTDQGTQWTPANSGLPSVGVMSLLLDPGGAGGGTLYAGTDSAGVWRRPLAELLDTLDGLPAIPSSYLLGQNYPNPFGAASVSGSRTTTMTFRIPQTSAVTLTVHEVMGREIAKLVDEVKNPGRYAVLFDADGLTAGIYMYRLRAGTYAATKKLLLLQ